MRPRSRTLSGRFSILRSSRDEITLFIVTLACRHGVCPSRSATTAEESETRQAASLQRMPLDASNLRVPDRTRQLFQAPACKDLFKLVHDRVMHQTIRRQGLAACDRERPA